MSKTIPYKLIFSFLFAALVFSAYSVAGAFSGDDASMGTVTVNLGGGGGRSAAWPSSNANGVLADLALKITMEGSTGTQTHTLDKGVTTASLKMAAGLWEITVEAYYVDILFGSGSNSVNVIAGQNNPVTIKMNESDVKFYVVSNADDWTEAVSLIGDNPGKSSVISVTKDININNGFMLNNSGTTVIICGNSTINLLSSGNLIGINGGHITIRDVKLKGFDTNTNPLVSVNGGTFTLEGSASVSNNKAGGGSTVTNGGGVYIQGGTFTMKNNASVSGNSAFGNGGGVYVTGNNSTFIMLGGVVSGNSADNSGGGVYVANGGTFRITTGTVSNNTASYGAALCKF